MLKRAFMAFVVVLAFGMLLPVSALGYTSPKTKTIYSYNTGSWPGYSSATCSHYYSAISGNTTQWLNTRMRLATGKSSNARSVDAWAKAWIYSRGTTVWATAPRLIWFDLTVGNTYNQYPNVKSYRKNAAGTGYGTESLWQYCAFFNDSGNDGSVGSGWIQLDTR